MKEMNGSGELQDLAKSEGSSSHPAYHILEWLMKV